MLKVIYKYSFDVTDYVTLSLPKGYRILKVDKCHDNEKPKMWVEIDRLNANVLEAVNFRIFGTGHEFDDAGLEYITTFFDRRRMHNGSEMVMVWHLYRCLNR